MINLFGFVGPVNGDLVKALNDSTDVLERATEMIEELEVRSRRAILDYTSTASARDRKQQKQKQLARAYYGCIDPSDPTKTVCMVTGVAGVGQQVVCAHIVPVRAKSLMSDFGLLGINMWDEYNCLLLAKPIEHRMDRGEMVS